MTYAISQPITSTRIARFGSGGAVLRSAAPIDDETLRYAAPSVFAESKHDSRSERYTHIPTSEVLKGLRNEGFFPYEVRQGGSRDEEKRGFTKHLIRLRREGDRQVGDSLRELVLLNSHDGTSSYQLMSGLFRLVCSNGLVIADGNVQMIRVPHKGDIVGQVVEGAYTLIDEGDIVDAQVDAMRSIALSKAEQINFAQAALTARYGEEKPPIEAAQLLLARRAADNVDDLWHTFNRVQENMIKGGLHYTQRDEAGRVIARRQTRTVNAVSGNVNLNRALWQLASNMQQIKQAA